MAGFADKLKKLFGNKNNTDSFYDDLTDSLIEGDLGAKTAYYLVEQLEKHFGSKVPEQEVVLEYLKNLLLEYVKAEIPEIQTNKTNIFLLLGVNGVGKTTSAAKLASWYNSNQASTTELPLVLAAADTFRAAAIDQLKIHGERLGFRVVAHKDGADPSAVVFDAAEAINSQGGGLVIADTAGRLHNKDNLVRELQKIDRTASSKATEGCYKKILVLDSTSGQNAFRQAESFHEAVGVDAVILAKYDSTARGGVAVAIGKELGIPVAFVGVGESYGDFKPFDAESYVREFLGL